MALQDIIKKIIEDAKKEVSSIRAEAEKECLIIKNESARDLKKQKEAIRNNLEKKKVSLDKKMETLAKMEKRNKILTAKQKVINKVFEKTLSSLNSLEDNDYKQTLEKLLKKLPKNAEGKIIAAKSKKALTEEAIKASHLDFEVSEEGNFSGGFIYKSDDIEVDSTFKNILMKDLKDTIEPKIAAILF